MSNARSDKPKCTSQGIMSLGKSHNQVPRIKDFDLGHLVVCRTDRTELMGAYGCDMPNHKGKHNTLEPLKLGS